jgi:hypothetical protein
MRKVSVTNGCGALPIDLRAEAPEAQGVVPVGTDAAAVFEPRLLLAALDAQANPPAVETMTHCWRHATSGL